MTHALRGTLYMPLHLLACSADDGVVTIKGSMWGDSDMIVCMCMLIYIYTYVFVYVCIYVYMYIYICIYMYIYMYINITHVCTPAQLCGQEFI